MPYQKSEPVFRDKEKKIPEPGIWRLKNSRFYLAEVTYRDPVTDKRIRERKTVNRLDLAEEWIQTRKADALRGDITRKRKVILFRDFSKEYFEVWRLDRKASTVYGEKKRIDGILKLHFGSKPIHTITRKDIERFIAYRRKRGMVVKQGDPKRGVSAASANRDLCRLKNMFKMAVAWDYLETNPAAGITQARERPEPADYLSKEEVCEVLALCDDFVRPLFAVALNTGMRWGEMLSLEWQDVNVERRLITVRDPKNRETRHIPMNRAVKEILAAHRVKQAQESSAIKKQVFVNKATGKPYNDLRKALRRALDAAGVTRHIRFHDLRHTAASHMVMAGLDLRTTGAILGHKDPKVTQRYAHLAPEHLKDAIEKLDFTEPSQGEGQGESNAESDS